jgi:hypothetical protein
MPRRGLLWQRSSRCDEAACVEVAQWDGHVLVRNSRHPDGPVVTFTAEEWRVFCAGVADGEFDVPR